MAFAEAEFKVVFADAAAAAKARSGLAAKAATRGLAVRFDASAEGAALAAATNQAGGANGAAGGAPSAAAILGANKRARAAVDLDGSLEDYISSGKKVDKRGRDEDSGWQASSSSGSAGLGAGPVTGAGNKLDMALDDFSGASASKRQRLDESGGWASGRDGGKGGRSSWNDANGGKGGKGKKGKGKKGYGSDDTAAFNA